ncbi:MAG: DMT family transporter [Rubrivivax sp.]|nr:MAG: DMT family transporter [Rubrivivax sp.]
MNTAPQVLARRPLWAGLSPASPRWLGALAVLLFAMTIPMTRLANGSVDAPQLPPLFVAVSRGAIAGVLAMVYLGVVRARRPVRAQWPLLAGVVVGGVLVFPLCMGWAVRVVPAAHAAVIIGLLPLCTAALASWWLGQRPGRAFWLAGALGSALVLGFALGVARLHGADHWVGADAWLLVSMLGASLAYVAGAALSRQMPAAQAISWSLVAALPITVPSTFWYWPTQAVAWQAWGALAYVALFSTWLGFFAWYAALARDPMRVSQLQLMQPFTSIALSALVLHESVDGPTWLVAGAVLMVVVWGQRAARMGGKP